MKYSGINFYPQSGISFNISYKNYDNFYTTEFDFISDNSNGPKLIIESGKIKDKDKNFIYFVDPKSNYFDISGNLSNNNFNIFVKNNIIYSSNDDYGFCSGINIAWNGSVNFEKDLDIIINGDTPTFSFDYKKIDYYLNPLFFKISGNENNLFPFFVNKIEINPLSAASEYFYFSGNENINFEVANGGYKELVIIQKDIYSSYFLPIVLDTNFGKIFQTLPILRFTNPPESGILTIENTVAAGSEFTLNETSLYSNWNFILDLYATEPRTSGFYIKISGLENNAIFKNNYQDSFTGSWIAAKNRDNTPASFAFDIEKKSSIALSDNTNSGQIIYNNVNSGINISGEYFGRIFLPSGIPEYHKKYWDITGITINLFKSGVPTGINNLGIIPIDSGLSGSILPLGVLVHNTGTVGWENGGPTRNNPSGFLHLLIYEGDNFTGLLNNFNKIYETGKNFTNLSGKYLTGEYVSFNTSNLQFNYTKQYILLFSGSASGYFSGTLTGITGDGLTGEAPIFFKDNIYLHNGNSIYNENSNIISSGLFGNFESGFETNLDKNIALHIRSAEIYDKNQITGFLKTVPLLNYQSYNIMIQKQIEFNNSFEFWGKSMYIISGTNNTLYSGLLFTDEDMFRQLRANYTITQEKY